MAKKKEQQQDSNSLDLEIDRGPHMIPATVEQLPDGQFAVTPIVEQVTQIEPVSSEDDPLLTQSQVARMCNKSPQTIGRWVMDGLLAFHRTPNGLPMIRKSVVDKFLGASCLKVV